MNNVCKVCIDAGVIIFSAAIACIVISKSSDNIDDSLSVDDTMYRAFGKKDKISIK